MKAKGNEHPLHCTCPRCVSAMGRANMAVKGWAVFHNRYGIYPESVCGKRREAQECCWKPTESVIRVLIVPLGRPRRGKKVKGK